MTMLAEFLAGARKEVASMEEVLAAHPSAEIDHERSGRIITATSITPTMLRVLAVERDDGTTKLCIAPCTMVGEIYVYMPRSTWRPVDYFLEMLEKNPGVMREIFEHWE